MTKIEFIMDLVNAGCDLRKLSEDTIELIDNVIPDVSREIDPKIFTDIIALVNNMEPSDYEDDRARYHIDDIIHAATIRSYRKVIKYYNMAIENLETDIEIAHDERDGISNDFDRKVNEEHSNYLSSIQSGMDKLKKLIDSF